MHVNANSFQENSSKNDFLSAAVALLKRRGLSEIVTEIIIIFFSQYVAVKTSLTMKQELRTKLIKELTKATELPPEQLEALVEQPKNKEHGDLAFPCFLLAKSWGAKPQECAQRLKSKLSLPAGFSEAHSIGPFLNFRFDRAVVAGGIVADCLKTATAPRSARDETVIVEYSSPNIAKVFHVGHIRGTLIGHALDKVYRYLGYKVLSINHLGDWGTQFGFVWAGCKLWGKTKEETVNALVELYRQATTLKDQQEKKEVPPADTDKPDVNELARSYFVDLENGKEDAIQFWKWCCDVSLAYFKDTYNRFGIRFDHYTGESFYKDMLEDVKQELEQKGLLIESQGALGVDLGEELGFARIYTPDGRSLYLTRDLATAKYRAREFNFDKAVYVVGTPQTLHFQQIKEVLKRAGHDFADRLVHVAFGHVGGMKTRGGGQFIELNDFLDEAYERSLTAYREQVSRRPEGLDEEAVAEAVALAAILYSTLGRSRLKDVEFSWQHSLEFQGDSGPYLLYAYARINGIKEKAAAAGITLPATVDASKLTDDHAFSLVSLLGDFDSVLARVAEENEPAYLAAYAHEIAKTFSKAYQALKVVGEEPKIATQRLALFEATRRILGTTLELLGMRLIERM